MTILSEINAYIKFHFNSTQAELYSTNWQEPSQGALNRKDPTVFWIKPRQSDDSLWAAICDSGKEKVLFNRKKPPRIRLREGEPPAATCGRGEGDRLKDSVEGKPEIKWSKLANQPLVKTPDQWGESESLTKETLRLKASFWGQKLLSHPSNGNCILWNIVIAAVDWGYLHFTNGVLVKQGRDYQQINR